ncbi:MAG: hypothetical protein SGPRY_010462 [Prymnesium sp.]
MRASLLLLAAASAHGWRVAAPPRGRGSALPSLNRLPPPLLAELPMPDTPQTEAERQAENLKMENDLAAFRAQQAADGIVSKPVEEETLLQKTINTLGKILTFNFFVICIFFLWFLTGVAAQFGLQQTAVIESFRGAWDLIILPLLSTHMALTFISAGLERI